MKHSVRKEDVTYVVQPEQKKVIAYIEGTQWMFTDYARLRCLFPVPSQLFCTTIQQSY